MAFIVARAALIATLGQPSKSGRNDVGLNELDYGNVVYRFQDCGRLEEVTTQAPLLIVGQATVGFDALAAFVRSEDSGAFERAGFLVSPRFGLAFDPGEPCWVTALAAHCIGEWRAL
ncbi:hypothetical protein [Variovorax sp. KK3]|uniref:hypothetical protein n=1 Tax=Variovorax sp. KK3 TaxID=1855728 RepID=UPI003AAE4BA9